MRLAFSWYKADHRRTPYRIVTARERMGPTANVHLTAAVLLDTAETIIVCIVEI